MQKWFLRGILLVFILIGCSKLFKFPVGPKMILEGTVLQTNEESTLISLRLDLNTDDLNKTYDDWMSGNYNLLLVNSLSSVEIGDEVKLLLKGEILETYPARATVKKYEIIEKKEVFQNITDKEVIESDQSYNKDLLAVFPNKIGLTQEYHGYAEYGYFQTLIQAEDMGNGYELNFNGKIMDGMGEFEPRLFTLQYEITNESVVEQIVNYDLYNLLEDELLLHSIIPHKIILKTPLEVGNSWIETFSYKGKDYNAKTMITRIELNSDEKQEYETLTIVEGIEHGKLGTYKENRIFTEGSGMTAFSNLFSSESIRDDKVDSSDDFYLFGFNLSHEQMIQ